MTTLLMMYLSFDPNGDIKSIGPTLPSVTEGYTTAIFPLSEVEAFLTGKRNPFDYYIKVTKDPVTYKIHRKTVNVVNFVRTLDHYLTEVPKLSRSSNATILIENLVNEKAIKVSVGAKLRALIDYPETDEQEEMAESFRRTPSLTLYFTGRCDPYNLLYTYTVVPNILLLDGETSVKYNMDLSNSSIYTKKLIDGYSYIIRK